MDLLKETQIILWNVKIHKISAKSSTSADLWRRSDRDPEPKNPGLENLENPRKCEATDKKAGVQTANPSMPSHQSWKMGQKSRQTHSRESNWEPEKSRLVPTVNSPLKSRRWPEFLFNLQRSWKEKKKSKEGFSLTRFCLFSDFSRVFFHQFQVCFYFQRFHEFFCSSISSFHLCPFQIKSSLEQRSEIGNLEKSEKKAKI